MSQTPKDQRSENKEWARVGNTGASTQVMDRNTALEETKIRCIITAKDKKSLWLLKNDFSASTIQVLQRDLQQVNDLKGQRLHFQIISTANGRPFPLRFSSGVSIVQKLNVGFANTVYFTEIQHYKQQAPPTPHPPHPCPPHWVQTMLCRVSSDMALLLWRDSRAMEPACTSCLPRTHTPACCAGHQSLSGLSSCWIS